MKNKIILLSLFQAFLMPCFAQNFTWHADAPFGIQTMKPDSTRTANTVSFYDLDNDGDLDAILSGLDKITDFDNWEGIHFFIEMQENIGTRYAPVFGERRDICEMFPYPVGYLLPSAGDLNHDHKVDFMIAAEIEEIGNQKIVMLTNTGLATPNPFESSYLDSMGLSDFVPESLFKPNLVDLDGDGDLDLINSGFNSAFAEEDGPNEMIFYYARNIGTPQVPNFQGWYPDPYGLIPDVSGELLASGDIDNDGDVDFVGSLINVPVDSNFYLAVHLNTPGTDSKPSFGSILKSPYGMPTSFGKSQLTFPTLADLDGDGDLDLFVFRGSAQGSLFQYYENHLCEPTTEEKSVTLCEGESIDIGGESYSQAGEYTIHLQSIHQCDSIIHLILEVLPVPTASIEASICDGDVYQLGNESFSTPGNYMVLVPAINGCDSLVFLTLTVHVIDPTVIAQDETLTANQSGVNYQWLNCDSGENIPGAVDQIFVPTVTGNYAVLMTDDIGCSVQSACVAVTITGLEESNFDHSVVLYPNPTSDILYIKSREAQVITNVTVMNLSGQVKGEFIPDGKNVIHLSALGAGVYIIKIRMNGKDVIRRLMIF